MLSMAAVRVLLLVLVLLLPVAADHVVQQHQPRARSANTSLPQLDLSSLGQVAALGSFSGMDIARASAASRALGHTRLDPQRSTLFARTPAGFLFPAGATDLGGSIHAVCSLRVPDGSTASPSTGAPRSDPQPLLPDPPTGGSNALAAAAAPFLDAADPVGNAADGQTVFVAGNFTAIGNITAHNIARWQPQSGSWSTLGSGINGTVNALHCSSARASLVVAGDFPAPAGVPDPADYAGHVALWDVVKGTWSAPSFQGFNAPVQSLAAGITNTSNVLFLGNFSLLWSSSAVPPPSSRSDLLLQPATSDDSVWTLPVALGSDPLSGLLAPLAWGGSSVVAGTASGGGYGSSSVLRCPPGSDGPQSSFFFESESGGGSVTINFGGAAEVRGLRISNSYANASGTTTFHVTPATAFGTDGTSGASAPPDALSWAYIDPSSGNPANCSTSCRLPRFPGVPYTDYVLLNSTNQYGVDTTSTMAGLTIILTGWTGDAPGLHSIQVLSPGSVVSANTTLNAGAQCNSPEPGAAGTSPHLALFSPADTDSAWTTATYTAQTLQTVAGGSSNTTETYSYFSTVWANASTAQHTDSQPQGRAEYYPSVLAAGNYTAYLRVPPCSQTPVAGGCASRTSVNVSASIPEYPPANVPASTHWAVVDQGVTSLTTVAVWTGALGPRTSGNATSGPIFTLSLANTAEAPNGTNLSTGQFALLADRMVLTLLNSTGAPAASATSAGILEYDPWDASLVGPAASWPLGGNSSAALPAQLGSTADRVGAALATSGAEREAALYATPFSVMSLASIPADQAVRDRVLVSGQFSGTAALLEGNSAITNQSAVDLASANVTTVGRGTAFANMAIWSTGAPGGNLSAPLNEGSSDTGSLLSPAGMGLSNPSLSAVGATTADGTLVYLAGGFAATSDGNISLAHAAAYNASSDSWVGLPAMDPVTFNASANGGNATQPPLGLGGSLAGAFLVQSPDGTGGGNPVVGFIGALEMPDLTGTGISVGTELGEETGLTVSAWSGLTLWNVSGGSIALPAGNNLSLYAQGSWLLPVALLAANMSAGHGFDLRTADRGNWEAFPFSMLAGQAETLADTLAPSGALLEPSSYVASEPGQAGVALASLNFSFVPPSLMYATERQVNGDESDEEDEEDNEMEDAVFSHYERVNGPGPLPPWTASGDVRLNMSALIPSSSNDALAMVRAGAYWTPLSARNGSYSGSGSGSGQGYEYSVLGSDYDASPLPTPRGGWMSNIRPTAAQGSEPALLILGGNFTSAGNVSNLGLYDPTSQSLLPFPPLPFDAGAGRAKLPADDSYDDSESSDSSSSSSGPDWSTTQPYLISDVHALTVVNQTLFVGATGGLLIFDLYNGAWLENAAPLSRSGEWVPSSHPNSNGDTDGDYIHPPVVVRKLLPKPGAEVMVVVGDFDAAGSLPCESICLWDFTGGSPSGRWMQLGSGFTGQVLDVDFADSDAEVLIVAGALTVDEQQAALAMWSLYNGTWKALGTVGSGQHQIPGPATAVSVNDLALNSIFIAGVSVFNQSVPASWNDSDSSWDSDSDWDSDSGTVQRSLAPRQSYKSNREWPSNRSDGMPYLLKWDGGQFDNLGSDILVGGRVTELAILPILTAGPRTDIIQDNRVLALTGQMTLSNWGSVGTVFFDGVRWMPFLTSQGFQGDPGSVLTLARQNMRVTFANLHHLQRGVVIAIAVFMSLGIVILLVLLATVGATLFASVPGVVAARDTELQMHSQSPALSALRAVGSSAASLSNASMSTSLSPALAAATGTLSRRWVHASPRTPNTPSGLRARFVRPKLPRRMTDQTAPSTTTGEGPRNDPSGSVLARLSDERSASGEEELLRDTATPRLPRTPSPLGSAADRDPLAGVSVAPLASGRADERDRRSLDQSPPQAPSGGMDLLAQLNAATEKVIRADSGGDGDDGEAPEDEWDESPFNSDEEEPPPPGPKGSRDPAAAMARAMQAFRHNQMQFEAPLAHSPPAPPAQYGMDPLTHPNPTLEGLLDHMQLSDPGKRPPRNRNMSLGTTTTSTDYPHRLSLAASHGDWGGSYGRRGSQPLQEAPPPVADLLPTLRSYWNGGYTPNTPFVAYVRTRTVVGSIRLVGRDALPRDTSGDIALSSMTESFSVHAGQELEILSDHDPSWWVARDAHGRIEAIPANILVI